MKLYKHQERALDLLADHDEELARRGVDDHRPGHRDGAAKVLETVHGLVHYGLSRGLLVHGLGESSALDHESVDDAVEYRAVVVARIRVLDEVLHGRRGLRLVKLK